ncbi:MAG TPA: RNase adapter RapZ [Pyrinomonadaceae bacterium]
MKGKQRAAEQPTTSAPDIVIITGLSGSGMSSATNAFEDLGYFCVDNLPLTLLPTFARLVLPNDEDQRHIERAALVVDIRERQFLSEFPERLDALRQESGLQVFVLFLEASDEALLRRFSETRRPHPADTGDGLLSAIRAERVALGEIRAHADHIIDTSEHTVHTLRRQLIERFSPDTNGTSMHVQVISFGHKHGGPRDTDLLFDVRHLPNPHFVPNLRDLSGHDRRVVEYLMQSGEVKETLHRFGDLLDYLLPLYRREGKSYVTVGIGCTGGRHRSVMIANALARRLRRGGFDTSVSHRDVGKTKRRTRSGKTHSGNADSGDADSGDASSDKT